MPKISNSCKPEISGEYSHENFTEMFGLSSFEMTSLAKPSKTQNLLPASALLKLSFHQMYFH